MHNLQVIHQVTSGKNICEIVISCNPYSKDNAANLEYEDFCVDYFINAKHITSLAPTLFEDKIDAEDWVSMYCETYGEPTVFEDVRTDPVTMGEVVGNFFNYIDSICSTHKKIAYLFGFSFSNYHI